MKKIVVPVDFSDDSLNALERAVFMSKKIDGEVILAHVIEYDFFQRFGLTSSKIDETIDEKFDELKKKYDTDFKVYVKQGSIYKEVVEIAKEEDAYMIIMGTHGHSGYEEFFLGSNANRIVMSSECPVLTLRADANKHDIKKIIMPVDQSSATRQKVPHALDLADQYGAEIHAIGICTSDSDDTVKTVQAYLKQIVQFIEGEGSSCKYDIVFGSNIAQETIDYANRVEADLIVIMTEQEVSARNLLLGPFAQQIVNHSDVPVLSIHPNPNLDHVGYGSI